MKILLVNDDGYQSKGILALARTLSKEHEVIICAPKEERSGYSQSITIFSPLLVKKVERQDDLPCVTYYVDGTPADCCRIALSALCPDVDLVVTGINAGYNVSVDVLYSGTVGCATEALLQGKRALAVSVGGSDTLRYDGACAWAKKIVESRIIEKMPETVLLSLNVPSISPEEIKGIVEAPLYMHTLSVKRHLTMKEAQDKDWVMTRFNHPMTEEGKVDTAWLSRGYATLTPINMDRTAQACLNEIHHALCNLDA